MIGIDEKMMSDGLGQIAVEVFVQYPLDKYPAPVWELVDHHSGEHLIPACLGSLMRSPEYSFSVPPDCSSGL